MRVVEQTFTRDSAASFLRSPNELKCSVRIDYRGEQLAFDHIISRIDLDSITPPRMPLNPMDYADFQINAERRKRMVDMLSSDIAHALTNALLGEK
jgi:hypothetical protein